MAPDESRQTIDQRTRSDGMNGQFEDQITEPWYRGNDSGKGGSRSNGYRPWKTRFSGEGKTSLKQYLRQFELVATFNNWDNEEKSLQLVTSLEGAALDTLDRVNGPMTYQGVVCALKSRFPDYDCTSSYQNAFDTASRRSGEEPGSLATRLGELAFKAYPDVPPGTMDRLILRRFTMAQPQQVRSKMALVNPTTIQEAVQLVSRLDGMEVDRLREVNVTTTAKPSRRKQEKSFEKSLNEALYDLRCVSSEEETESPSEGEPGDIVAALAQVNPDFAEIFAATLANHRPEARDKKPMTCYFCKEVGHTWLKCSKLWDQLKLNGFKPNMSRDKGGTYPKKRSRPPQGGRADKGGSQPSVN